MKKNKRQRTLRTVLLSALLIAVISSMSAILAVNAAEEADAMDSVSVSDAASESVSEAANDEEVIVSDEAVEVIKSYFTITQDVDAKRFNFKPNATYNGSFKSELIENEVPIYDAFVSSMVTNRSNDTVTVDIRSMGYSSSQSNEVSDLIISAYAAFTMDYPEVYWVSGYSTTLYGTSDGLLTKVEITANERYSDAYSELNTVLNGINSAVNAISQSRASTSRYDTVKAIHDYICNTMEYDHEAADQGTYGEAHCIAPLFGGGSRGHQFVCEGYANSFKLLCDKFGIPAVHIKGTAGGPHSWNYVQMEDNRWYGVDSTWDDGSSLIYTYFLIGSNSTVFNGKTFGEDHIPGNQVMTTPTVYPLVYPDLAAEKYTPVVSVPATGITLSKTSLSLTNGNTATLTATVTPSNSTDSVVWTSNNTSVATVSNGVVTAVGNGSATITATAGSKKATCSVTVTTPATGITLSKTSLSLTNGNTATLTATVTPSNSTDSVVWTSNNTSVATVSNGVVTAVGNGSATITATAGSKSATCSVTVTSDEPTVYDVTPNINGGASKLYEPWGLRYYAAYNGNDIDKIADRGIAILKETYYSTGITPVEFCANEKAHIFLASRNELVFEAATSANPNGRYFATLTEGIYSYDIGSKYYVVPFAVMADGQTIYGAIKSNSMENILKANLSLSTITSAEKAICTCILELKKSVAQHYEASGVPGASIDINVPRGSSQAAANSIVAAGNGVSPNVVGGASRLIEPWGLRYFAEYGDSANISQRGMVILNERYYDASYSTSPDGMRLNANAYVFRDSDGTLTAQSGTARYYGTLTEGISSKDIADVYYVVPFVVLNDGSYVYGTVKSNSMMKIMKANLNSSAVPETERAVSEDIIDLYNAVKAYYEGQ